MQFDEPFTNVAPFKFAATPATGSESLGVVGYPGDMRMNGESGAQMYEVRSKKISQQLHDSLEYGALYYVPLSEASFEHTAATRLVISMYAH